MPASRIDVFLPFMLTSQVEGSNNRHSRSTRLYNLRPLTVFSWHCERVRPAFGGGFEPPRRASWLCFARSAAFVVTHGAPPLSAVTPAEGGWATSDALEGTIQTAPLSPLALFRGVHRMTITSFQKRTSCLSSLLDWLCFAASVLP